MKKVLFLLLVTSISYGQALFDKGVKITGGQTTTTATNKIISQEANGVLNQINATSLPISTATANALDLRTENSSGAIDGFAITNNGDGTVNIATGTAYLRQANNPYSPIIKYVIPAVTNLALTDNANNFVLVDYNVGSPSLTVTTSPGTINTTTNSIAYLISRVGTTLDYINLVGQNVDANGKLRRRFLNSESLRRAQGAVLTSSNRNLLVTAGLFYSGLIEVSTPLFNTSTVDTFTQVYINGTWERSTGNTQVNNTQYSLAGILTTMPSNDYRVDYVYILADNPSKLYVLLGTTTYNNIGDARLSPVPVNLPSELQYLGTRIGRVIIRKDATTMEASSEYATIYQAGSAQLHNDLGGLNLGDFQHLTVAEKANNELKTNKQNSLAVDGTGIKYPTVDATNAGLATKQNTLTNPITGTGTTNTIPKFTGTNTLGDGSIRDNVNVSIGTGGFSNKLTLYSNANEYALRVGQNTSNITNSFTGITFYNSTNTGGTGTATGTASLKITRTAANLQGNLAFLLGATQVGMFDDYGHLLLNTTTSNGIDALQTPLTISHAAATTANQGVVKSQLDLKADLANPTFTGVPSVPTATTGTNTTQIASTAFVNSEIALKGYWTKTGNDIRNNNTGEIQLKPLTKISILNSADSEVAKITEAGNFIAKTNSAGFFGYDDNSGMFFDGGTLNFRAFGDSNFRFNPIFLNRISGLNNDVVGFSNQTINPTSGSVNFNMLNISPIVNQTGSANGITRSLYINPTLTSAFDYRAIEVTAGKTILQETKTLDLIVSNLGGGPSRIVSADVDGKLSAASVFTHQGQIAVTNSVTANSFIKTGGTSSQFLKADGSIDESDIVKNIAKDATQGANVTGTVSETILYSKLIPANTFKDGDFMTLFSRVAKSTVLGGLTQKVKINTSNTLTDATQIAQNFMVAANTLGHILRTFNITNGFIVGVSSNTNFNSDIINSGLGDTFSTFDPTVDNYIFITGQLSNSADTMYHLGTKITN